MPWSLAGALTLLDLRSVAVTADGADFQRCRRQGSPRERYHPPYPQALPAIVALDAAAELSFKIAAPQ